MLLFEFAGDGSVCLLLLKTERMRLLEAGLLVDEDAGIEGEEAGVAEALLTAFSNRDRAPEGALCILLGWLSASSLTEAFRLLPVAGGS
jgi:hypothetical protein